MKQRFLELTVMPIQECLAGASELMKRHYYQFMQKDFQKANKVLPSFQYQSIYTGSRKINSIAFSATLARSACVSLKLATCLRWSAVLTIRDAISPSSIGTKIKSFSQGTPLAHMKRAAAGQKRIGGLSNPRLFFIFLIFPILL